jgi:hypothetical protein
MPGTPGDKGVTGGAGEQGGKGATGDKGATVYQRPLTLGEWSFIAC